MKKKRRLLYQRRARERENMDEGQDSFLDVVSNLVGVLIILVMVAGARARNAASEIQLATTESVAETSDDDAKDREDKKKYVEAVEALEKLREDVEKTRTDAEEMSERRLIVEQQADGAEAEYQYALAASAEIDGMLELQSREQAEAEKIAFDLKSEIFEKEKKRDDLKREKEALEAARPKATVLENIPTPISKKVEEGREGFFRLKDGKIARVPLDEFMERVRLYFKNFRGDVSQKEFEEKVGPVDNFYFHYFVSLDSTRGNEGTQYFLQFQYGECLPARDDIGEPVDQALADRNSNFFRSLLKYSRENVVITIFVYPDSYKYLRDVKKTLFSLGYATAMRPMPDGAKISISPQGTASATY